MIEVLSEVGMQGAVWRILVAKGIRIPGECAEKITTTVRELIDGGWFAEHEGFVFDAAIDTHLNLHHRSDGNTN